MGDQPSRYSMHSTCYNGSMMILRGASAALNVTADGAELIQEPPAKPSDLGRRNCVALN